MAADDWGRDADMKPMRAILAVCIAGVISAVAAGRGYLPAAGPVPLRFMAPLRSLSSAVLPPLLMVTRAPVDPETTNGPAGPEGWPQGAGSETNTFATLSAVSVAPSPPNPYDQGLVPSTGGSDWPSLYFSVTNGPGVLSIPVQAPVNFTPPVPAPQSRATYTTTP